MNLKKLKLLNAFTLAGGRSPLLYGDEGTQGSPRLVKRGFTLAEVLITLGVIGVVAAVTMPTLIKNYQKKQTVTQLKKAYSELSQAISMAQKDFGPMEDWDFADFPDSNARAQYFYNNFLKPNLKIAKYCSPTAIDCWQDKSYTLKGTEFGNLKNYDTGSISFITDSGYSVYYWMHAIGTGGWFFIDLNGKKLPNVLGKDIFVFELYNNLRTEYNYQLGLNPYGFHRKGSVSRDDIITGNYPFNSGLYGGCSSTAESAAGVSCAALIMIDGWEIKDDYPW